MNHKGQALIEFLVAAAVLKLVFVVSLGVVYLSWGRLWLAFQSAQTYNCLADGYPLVSCRRQFVQAVASGLPLGRLQNVQLQRTHRRRGNQYYRLSFVWRVWGWKLIHRGQLSYLSLMYKAKRDLLFYSQ